MFISITSWKHLSRLLSSQHGDEPRSPEPIQHFPFLQNQQYSKYEHIS